MYRVLLVDDEPLVLSGIKFLLDWSKLNCKIINTARNGKQALEIIEIEKPDIVLCDINMPVLSGLEVLKEASKIQSMPVFVMLTNHQEFDMARESLRYKAVDYLLKTQLEAEILEKAMQNAIQECDKRNKMAKIDFVNAVIEEDDSKIIMGYLRKILEREIEDKNNESYHILEDNHILDCFALLEIVLDFSILPKLQNNSIEDRERIFGWEHELLETILPKIFKDYLLLYSDTRYQRFRVFIWNIDEQDFAMDIETFHSKILLASSNVTSTKISLLVSDVLRGKDIFDGLQQMDELLEYYYSNEPKMAWYKEVRQQRYDELRITILINKLVIAIRSKNVAECKVILEQIQEKFANTYHSRMVGIRSCIDLYSTIYTILVPLLPEDGVNTYFIDLAKMIQNINQMLTLSELQTWLKQFEEQVIHQLEQMTEVNCEIIERVKSYILTHAKEKLMLQDIADYVNMSPSYLSALFKKQCNQNLVDYINEVKMNKACELIREGKYKIYEISYLLSFENAYYFTKVFKRYIGRTPKQYQNRVKGR
ncbi:MAG: response regulator [Zhenhengia sp.]|uniref:response regulator transcription factor n=1 Tax=Zhenhengia sp. TaxID=2944208 RepID=UPI00290653D3|nr:response regulator [Clostridiales bacterium]MDU6975848.1 response regulator [Clostridiales bacterium]